MPQTLAEALEAVCAADAPLNARLATYAAHLRQLNRPVSEAYDELIERLQAGSIGSEAPGIGESMPPFLLPSRTGHLVSLDEVTASGPVVITFNRGHWCSLCRIHLRTIASYHRELSALGAQVVSIVPDRQQFVGRLRLETEDRIHILSDLDNSYSLSLGLVMWLGDRIIVQMQSGGLDLEAVHGARGWFVPVPATFIVGRNGRVAGRYIDPDFRKRMEIDEIVSVLQRLL